MRCYKPHRSFDTVYSIKDNLIDARIWIREVRLMPRSLSIGLIVGLIITALSTSIAQAEPRHCFWNAEGLPYSINPPPNSEPADELLTPAQMTFALYINSPGLPFKHACGEITDADLVKAREMYRYWDCSAESSVGQMVEGLRDGGPFVWSAMFAFEDFYAKNPDVLPIMCPHVAGVERVCFLTPPSGDKELEARHRIKFPQCVAYYDWLLKVRPQFERLGFSTNAYNEELGDQGHELLKSADVRLNDKQ